MCPCLLQAEADLLCPITFACTAQPAFFCISADPEYWHVNRRWDDASVSPVLRQTLLHWAYELTEADFEQMRKKV